MTQTTSTGGRRSALREYIATENSSAVVLLTATVVALIWANSPWAESYEAVWGTEIAIRVGGSELALDLRHWINDGLMALFFFVVGLEIRREFDMGELRERRRVATPVLAAIGGMAVPAAIYLLFNAGEASARGWGIVMGTDTAFALGILTLVGGAAPRVRAFLLTLVIVDDIFALLVIALAYTSDLAPGAFVIAIAFFGMLLVLRRLGIHSGVGYFLVVAGMWLATLMSGVHATIAGVAAGLLATAHPPQRSDLEHVGSVWRLFREEPTPGYARTASRVLALTISPNERFQHRFHSWTSLVVVPIFALANAGVRLDGEVVGRALGSPITLGIVFGLVVGKLVGITGATWLATRFGGFPMTVPWPPLVGVGAVAGIGFTVSLLIAEISFDGTDLEEAKVGILAASVIASLVAWGVFSVIRRLPDDKQNAGRTNLAPPIRDLADIIDPEVDHIRGNFEAPVTVVEYGDFECPFCGNAESVLRTLADTFGDDFAFVFRHLPLVDVHEHAQVAAEAAEAAGAQGFFWEMHDVLIAPDAPLTDDALVEHARRIGLDVDRFATELAERRYALRVSRDVATAEESGAAGTPTIFINGSRYNGRFDVPSLSDAIAKELRTRIG